MIIIIATNAHEKYNDPGSQLIFDLLNMQYLCKNKKNVHLLLQFLKNFFKW